MEGGGSGADGDVDVDDEAWLRRKHAMLTQFWTERRGEVEENAPTTDAEFKASLEFPLSRIKRIVRSDEDVRMISSDAPVVFAKACEWFILELTKRAWLHAEHQRRRTLQREDILAAIVRTDTLDFLAYAMEVGAPGSDPQAAPLVQAPPVASPGVPAAQPAAAAAAATAGGAAPATSAPVLTLRMASGSMPVPAPMDTPGLPPNARPVTISGNTISLPYGYMLATLVSASQTGPPLVFAIPQSSLPALQNARPPRGPQQQQQQQPQQQQQQQPQQPQPQQQAPSQPG